MPGLCDAIAGCGLDVVLASQNLANDNISNLIMPSNTSINTHLINAIRIFRNTYSFKYHQKLTSLIKDHKCDIIHSHGLWLQCNRHAAICARNLNIPHIISTRGMLEPWAFAHNFWKKRPLWFIWQKRALQEASAFCATSKQEAEGIRSLGFSQPIAIIPNGINLSYCNHLSLHNNCNKFALFLSRIHPKKGLIDLVDAWAKIRPLGWQVVIAGPDENGHQAEVQRRINELGVKDVFKFIGSVDGAEKGNLYRSANLFILPTHSENFGIVIAEALASGTPVITTKGTPWEGLLTHKCGWWIDIGVQPLANTIQQAINLSDAERAEMGARGKRYVLDEFSWEAIGQKMVAFYDWILKGGTPPDHVLTL